ncbi:3-ketoacyl-ACP reductase [Candidatus Riesia sp. GBBU]|nr:3-ketoacyl-ACP reductase [Candidatus Riesia sp. GBBU]
MNFTKKIVLVTGASKGIGMEISTSFMKKGAVVIGTSRSKKGVEIINDFLQGNGKGYILDVTRLNSICKIVSEVKNEFGEIDILINNAGIIIDNLLVKMVKKHWDKVIKTNLTSVFMLSKAVVKPMIRKRYGRIISISSVSGISGNIGQTNYSSSKAGIIAFSKSLAREISSKGVTVNVVSPGFIETNMIKKFTKKQRKIIESQIPIGRFGYPKEVAEVVLFLASEKSSYITGETINVNGGIYMI